MKKILTVIALTIFGFGAIAQDSLLVSKSGSEILPKKGDIGVGISADPFFQYVGNMFNGNTNNSLNLNDNTLYFRYFIKDDAAVRVALRINSSKDLQNYYVIDDAAKALDPLSLKEVEDRRTSTNNSYELRIGYQQFRGYKRLRGFYGADLGFAYYKSKEKYEYGNTMSELNPSPTTNWGSLSDRTLENNYGAVKRISLGIFTGAEYYIMPKICLGAEFGLHYGMTWEGQSSRNGEKMVVSQLVNYDKTTSGSSKSSNLATDFPYGYGTLYFMFHF